MYYVYLLTILKLKFTAQVLTTAGSIRAVY